MTMIEKINLWQMIFTGAAFVAALIATALAYRIGKKQNEINEKALNISNFVEVFIMPQQLIAQNQDNPDEKIIKWNILVKNVSSYPIYLKDFTLNGIKHDVGSSAIPNDKDSWYAIPIPQNTQDKKEFSLAVTFEDYLGNNYQSEAFGLFDGLYWQIKSKKRIEL